MPPLHASSEVEEQVESLGCGKYQALLLLAIGVAFLAESLEMGAVSPLHTALGHAYGLSRGGRVWLAATTYAGSIGGMVVAGPLADIWGRKKGLLLSLLLVCLSSCAHAALPLQAPFFMILVLRVLAGLGTAISLPTGITLAAESTPEVLRLRLVLGTSFLGTLGYVLEAVGIQWFMPHFGEKDSDNWRGLCLFIGIPAFAALPLVWLLQESPMFLATTGRWEECNKALQEIAAWNNSPLHGGSRAPEVITDSQHRGTAISRKQAIRSWKNQWPSWRLLVRQYALVLVVLTLMDAAKSFFVSGSAYLCKDLFEMTRTRQSLSPTALNMFASISPLLGLLIGERFVCIGVRALMVSCSFIASAALTALAFPKVRRGPGWVLSMVLLFKLTYGPMGTCLSMMKVEAFPTQFRASAFAAICAAGKLLCALGPMLLEGLKPEEDARSWDQRTLEKYIIVLAVAALAHGVLAFFIPRACGQGPRLRSLSASQLVGPAAKRADSGHSASGGYGTAPLPTGARGQP